MSEIVDNLKKLCDEHERQISEIRQKISAIELIPRAKSLVGKCFKYPNSYGYFGFGISNVSKRRGYIYKRIVSCDKEYVVVDTLYMEHPGKIEFLFGDKHYVTSFNSKSFIQISEKEYFRAFNKILKHVLEAGKKEK